MTMTHSEYRKALATLELTQGEASRIVAADARTGRRWATGETAIPGSVELLIRLWLADAGVLEASRRLAALRDKKASKESAHDAPPSTRTRNSGVERRRRAG